MRALGILDEVQHLPQLERFEPARFVAAVEAELAAPGGGIEALAGQLEALRGVLGAIDRFAQKAMRIRLLHAGDALPPQLRTLVQTTIVAYQSDLPLLRARIARAAGDATDAVLAAAREVLATRAALRAGVLEIARRVAAGWIPIGERAARDRSQPDEQRDRWNRARADLAAIAARGDALDAGSFEERLARATPAEDPPEEERPHRFELLEID
jgi:hypothetical protein